MPVDPNKAQGHVIQSSEGSWGPDDIILYNLGIGAGRDPMDSAGLEYVYENNLKAIPSFGVIPVFSAMFGMFDAPGIDINPMMILHGEQDLTIHGPIPTAATVVNAPRISEVFDKGKGALINMEVVTSNKETGEPIFTNTFGCFVRGEGGFGGDSGPAPGNVAPDREPDHVLEATTEPWQALLYRLSGDKNPLHADPKMAAMAGFDRPILHGLCTFGVVCRTVVDGLLGGDAGQVARYQVRFSAPVIPGETIVVRAWDEGEKIILEASAKDRGVDVLKNAAITRRG